MGSTSPLPAEIIRMVDKVTSFVNLVEYKSRVGNSQRRLDVLYANRRCNLDTFTPQAPEPHVAQL